jgi:hypothetical protein
LQKALRCKRAEGLFLNAVNHFLGDHSQCPPHDHEDTGQPRLQHDDEDTIRAIRDILEKIKIYFDFVEPGAHTQSNESFNAAKSRLASKNIAWRGSWAARVSLATLHFNEPFAYYFAIVDRIERDTKRSLYTAVERARLAGILRRFALTRNTRHGPRPFKLKLPARAKVGKTEAIHLRVPRLGEEGGQADDFSLMSESVSDGECSDDNLEIVSDYDSDHEESDPSDSFDMDDLDETECFRGTEEADTMKPDLCSLSNIGKTCWLNSLLILFFHCSRTAERLEEVADEGTIIAELSHVRARLLAKATPQSIVKFHRILAMNQGFRGAFGRPQDPPEMFEKLMNILCSESPEFSKMWYFRMQQRTIHDACIWQ